MATAPLRALVTNDDGIGSVGLLVLAEAVSAAGLDVVVAAPHTEASGTAAGLTVVPESGRAVIEPAELDPGYDGACFSVTAHPAFITLAAIGSAFGPPPDLVLSGVNRGANTGRAVLHSGTVGAALTAGSNGLRGLAVSLAVPADDVRPPQWGTVGGALPAVLSALLDSSPGTVLNVNIPDVPPDRLGALTDATLSTTGVVQARTGGEPGMAPATTVVPGDAEPGSDAYLLNHGSATVTQLRPISDAGGRFGRPLSHG